MNNLIKLSLLTLGAMAGKAAVAEELCTVDFRTVHNWGHGATQSIKVTNLGPALQEWELSWKFGGSEQITNLWNGKHVQIGNQVGVIDAGYNAKVATGATFNFGFNIADPSETLPTAFFLNGKNCSTGEPGDGDNGGGDDGDDGHNGTPDPVAGKWQLDNARSTLNFVTVKNEHNAEVQSFTEMSASINEQGMATLAIDLNSVATNIAIRDGRLKELLFETDILPMLYLKTQIDLESVSKLAVGQSQVITLSGDLLLHGVSKPLTAEVLVVKNSAGSATVSSFKPVVINSTDFELSGGLEVLRALAGLMSIGEAVPVYFQLQLEASEDAMPIQIAATPAAPAIVGGTYTAATMTSTVNWQDLSDNETGFMIKRMSNDSYWQTVGTVAANQTSFSDQLDAEGEFAYRVVALNGSVPSESSAIVVVDTAEDGDGGTDGGDGDGGTGGGDGDGDGDGGGDGADTGKGIYEAQCASCHGDDGSGGSVGVALTSRQELTALASYIEARMPLGNPTACGADCSDKVAAYIAETFWDDVPVDLEDETPGPRQLNLLTRYQYENTVQDLLGVTPDVTNNFPVEAIVRGFDNNASKNVVTSRHVDEYLGAAETLAERAVAQRRAQLLSCDPGSAGCAERFIKDFGLKAFRRPLTAAEQSSYGTLFESEGDFNAGMRQVIQAMLVSPNFLYISELGEAVSGNIYRLTPYEVASQLSYMFHGSAPDAALLQAAASNALSTPAQLNEQARRLLQSPKAREHMGHFVAQWLEADQNSIGSKDMGIYPNFTPAVRAAMDMEMKAFFNHVVFDSTQMFDELFNADYVFVNNALANYYGIPGVTGNTVQKVADTTGNRGGLLTLGAVMAAHGHANETAPVPRGAFVRDRIMCQQLPPPPVDLDTSFPDPDPEMTTRERFAERTKAPECQACHLYLNGVGFGFEAFDGAGGFRTKDKDKLVDTSAVIHGLDGLLSSTTAAYDGARDMQSVLAETDGTKACMATQFYRFSRGYVEASSDRNTLANLVSLFASNNFNLQDLMIGVTQLQSFTLRRDR